MIYRLDDRALIAVTGPEARNFVQGLVTNDVSKVAPLSPRYAALLTPQGKVLFDFLIADEGHGLLLDCVASLRDGLIKRLSLYRLRAKIEIRPRDDLVVVWQSNGDAPPPFSRDPRHPDLGWRAYLSADTAPSGVLQFQAVRLRAGIPEGRDFGQDKIFALDADLDELGGISFEKGCYVGQELTARMKHRGTARKRLLPVEALDGGTLAIDVAIAAGNRELGSIQSVYGRRGFALVRLDRLEESAGGNLLADEWPVRIDKPEWLLS